jgi:septal ring factor EnvC (AmiA/AmiB activator)
MTTLEEKIDELEQADNQARLARVQTATTLYEKEITSLESQIAYLTKQLSAMQDEKDFYKHIVVDF